MDSWEDVRKFNDNMLEIAKSGRCFVLKTITCRLCGKPNTSTLDECAVCQDIPQSHPYRQLLTDKVTTDLCTGQLIIETGQDRNKYRRTNFE